MNLYTFIMEFEGGSYISQVEATTPEKACKQWAENLEEQEIVNFGKRSKELLLSEINSEVPVHVKDVENVWCVSYLIRGKLALVTFIQTQKGFN